MYRRAWAKVIGVAVVACGVLAGEGFTMDVMPTSAGDLKITCSGHGTLMFACGDKVIRSSIRITSGRPIRLAW